jgi:hypothetical protein
MRERVTEAVRVSAFHARVALTGRTNHGHRADHFERLAPRAPRGKGQTFDVTFRRVPRH